MFVGDVRNFTRSNSRSQREIQESLPPQARLQWSPGLFAPIWSASSHNLHPSSSSPLLPCSYRKILRLMFYCLLSHSSTILPASLNPRGTRNTPQCTDTLQTPSPVPIDSSESH
ncbi:hypothetical protein BFJ69_g17765, partial [Fusarium oxysporum]